MSMNPYDRRYTPIVRLWFRNNKKKKHLRFISAESTYYDLTDENQKREFESRSFEIAKDWGFNILSSQQEYDSYPN